ncbi:hypothetical protein ACFSRY_18680 [Pontibacter locisalis]|uniref:Uncharacterized protein n=1 Tax=Pontibacter locisalis TaxID=1719035 RepID=A0ABW5IR80_9BACT
MKLKCLSPYGRLPQRARLLQQVPVPAQGGVHLAHQLLALIFELTPVASRCPTLVGAELLVLPSRHG